MALKATQNQCYLPIAGDSPWTPKLDLKVKGIYSRFALQSDIVNAAYKAFYFDETF